MADPTYSTMADRTTRLPKYHQNLKPLPEADCTFNTMADRTRNTIIGDHRAAKTGSGLSKGFSKGRRSPPKARREDVAVQKAHNIKGFAAIKKGSPPVQQGQSALEEALKCARKLLRLKAQPCTGNPYIDGHRRALADFLEARLQRKQRECEEVMR